MVAGYPTRLQRNAYTNGRQQDSFLFLIEFINKLSTGAKALFRFTTVLTTKCTCDNQYSFRDRIVTHISISLSKDSPLTNFYETFTTHSERKCPACRNTTLHRDCNKIVTNPCHKFVIIYVQGFHNILINQQSQNIRTISSLTGYNPERIIFPDSNEVYQMSNVIFRHGETIDGGHYTIFTRNLNGHGWWLNSDSNYQFYNELPNILNHVQYILLTKI